jgi:ABC-type sugar transport system ATPase subunit
MKHQAIQPRLEVLDCRKEFPGVVALDDVSFSVMPGEIHALLGENGAGKSTLGKVIGGVYEVDAGEIYLDGAALVHFDEATACKLGIGIVHQEGSLVPNLSVAENIFAGRQPLRWLGGINKQEMHDSARKILNDFGVTIDPSTKVAQLSAAQSQIVEIAKTISLELKLLVLDEPTAALTQREVDLLFDLVRRIARSGVGIVYVSHRLDEIFALCDRITVLKDGRLTGERNVSGTTMDELVRLMVGRDTHFERVPKKNSGALVLEVNGLSSPNKVVDATFNVHSGEIVCLAGLAGSGRSEVCEAIFGARRFEGGIKFRDKSVHFKHTNSAISAGIGMVPEDRKSAGLFLSSSVTENITSAILEQVSPYGVVSKQRTTSKAENFRRRLNIVTPSLDKDVGHLSGGNQQKVLLAKWLATNPQLLIVDEPTRGVDVGARAEIYKILTDLRDSGVAILAVSSDLTEVLTLADRIVVMSDGRTVSEINGDNATEESILSAAAGSTKKSGQ